ncbi:MAG TPA: hypothetical protein VN673_11645 [Clostridia bacterium]|nr:hypothetical protein [Clostridia bacterium]
MTIITFVLLIFSSQVVPRNIIALVASGALGLIVVGLVSGIVALFGISKQGKQGILAPAIVGIIINGLLLAFVVTSFITARFRAKQQQGGLETSPVVAMGVSMRVSRIPGGATAVFCRFWPGAAALCIRPFDRVA